MARFCPLFSGSSGNCTYVGTPEAGVLIDAGVSARRIERALRERDIDPLSIRAVFVTHEHIDHVAGLAVLVKRFRYPIYGTAGTLEGLLDRAPLLSTARLEVVTAAREPEAVPAGRTAASGMAASGAVAAAGGGACYGTDISADSFSAAGLYAAFDTPAHTAAAPQYAPGGRAVEAGGMEITAFATSHDSRESCGFHVRTPDGRRLAVATDTGCLTGGIRRALEGCDLVLLESNYDADMLRAGPYPWHLKKRIACDRGHLSNACCAGELPRLAEGGTTRLFLGHLSRENNRPEVARRAALAALEDAGLRENRDFVLAVAPRDAEAPVMIL